jgi:hypothetical protein
MTPTYTDRWNSERFTGAELDQLVLVAAELSAGSRGVDSRRLSAKVRRWLLRWNYCVRTGQGFRFTDLLSGVTCDSWLPVEALERL